MRKIYKIDAPTGPTPRKKGQKGERQVNGGVVEAVAVNGEERVRDEDGEIEMVVLGMMALKGS